MKAIGILWNSMNKYTDLALRDINDYSKITNVISIDFGSSFSEFISKIYPYVGNERWKLDYKISHMNNVYESNEIKIVFLDIDSTKKIFVERKGIYIYENVEKLKTYVRNKYKNMVENYVYDNVFHMTDDENEYSETLKIITDYVINYYLKTNKIFNLNKILYNKTDNFIYNYGKRKKIFLFDNNLIYKEQKPNTLESYAEVFCYHLFKKCDIDNAEYYFAKYNNNCGIITKNFVNSNEIFIDGTHLIDAYLNYKEKKNTIFSSQISHDIELITKYNNVDDLIQVFKTFAAVYNLDIDLVYIKDNLKKIYALDLIFLQSDRNSNNWGILLNKNTGKIKFAPLYDNSNIFNFNNPNIVNKMLENIGDDQKLYSLALEKNPTLLNLYKTDDLFESKTILISKINDETVIEIMKELIIKIDNFNLNKLVHDIVGEFPNELTNNKFNLLITKLLLINISYIKDNLIQCKRKLLK